MLSELLRAGRLSEHDLQLAAYAGDPAAGRILGTADNQAGSPGAEEWLAGLRRWGYPALIAAALGALDLAIRGAAPSLELEEGAIAVRDALAEWLSAPSAETLVDWPVLAGTASEIAQETDDHAVRGVSLVASYLGEAPGRTGLVPTAGFRLIQSDLRAGLRVMSSDLGLTPDQALAAMRESVIRWAFRGRTRT